MIDLRMNYKGKYQYEESLACPIYGEVSDNTEHLLQYNKTRKYTEADLQNKIHVENWIEIIKIINENQDIHTYSNIQT